MEPIPETFETIKEFGPFLSGGEDTLTQIKAMAERVRLLVPECVGMSVAILEDGVTLTLVATEDGIAALDGVQYLSDGPCVRAADEDRTVEYRATDAADEGSWRLFAEVTAAAGIASTLTLPILDDDEVVGTVNLYASTPEAFTGRHEPIAAVLGAWAPGAVTNADLAFDTRRTAQQAPRVLHDEMRIEVAIGIIVASEGIDRDTARERLRQAAERAGVSETAVAKRIIGRLSLPDDPPDAATDDS